MQAYLTFNGNCAEAFAFYAKCLNGSVPFSQSYGDAPGGDQTPAEFKTRIMHARLVAEGMAILGSDLPSGMAFDGYKGFSICVQAKDTAQGEATFNALAADGKVNMPYGKTFWAQGFGMLVDKFGVPWMVNCE